MKFMLLQGIDYVSSEDNEFKDDSLHRRHLIRFKKI